MKRLRGMVMCGGLSKRMGTDKGLIAINDTCWAVYMAIKLLDMNMPVCISINASQIEKYRCIFDDDKLVVDSQNIAGPLNGLLSVHVKYPDDDLLLLACDMVDMQSETLSELVVAHQNATGYDNYVYQNQNFLEPFCAIYGAVSLRKLIGSNHLELADMGLKHVLNMGDTLLLPIENKSSFANYNTLP